MYHECAYVCESGSWSGENCLFSIFVIFRLLHQQQQTHGQFGNVTEFCKKRRGIDRTLTYVRTYVRVRACVCACVQNMINYYYKIIRPESTSGRIRRSWGEYNKYENWEIVSIVLLCLFFKYNIFNADSEIKVPSKSVSKFVVDNGKETATLAKTAAYLTNTLHIGNIW